MIFMGAGETPAGGNTGRWWYLSLRGCPISRVHSTNPKDLGPEDPYPKGNLRKEGKREDGSLDFSLRLVAPGGPADLIIADNLLE